MCVSLLPAITGHYLPLIKERRNNAGLRRLNLLAAVNRVGGGAE